MKSFEKKYPALKIILVTNNENEHWNKLVVGSIDAIVDSEPRVSNQWESYILYSDCFNFFVSPHYKVQSSSMDIIYVDKASDENGLSFRDHFIKSGASFNERYKLDTFISVQAFANHGLGIGVLPERLAQADVAVGKLQQFSIKGFQVEASANIKSVFL